MSLASLVVTLVCASPGEAQLPTHCEARVSIEGALPARWTRVLPALCERLEEMPDADARAQLVLRPAGRDLRLLVKLADGRVAERLLHRPSELLVTTEALTAVPLSMTSEPARPTDPPAELAAGVARPEPAMAMAKREEPPTRARLELGAGLMLRADGRPLYLSAGLQGHGAFHVAWLTFALAARWDGYQSVVVDRPTHLEMSTAGGGAWILGRILERSRASLDAGATLWVLSIMQTRGEGADERGGSAGDVRVGGMLRARFGRGSYQTSLALDLELSRRRLRNDLRLDRALPTLPAWSLGLTVGMAWQAI